MKCQGRSTRGGRVRFCQGKATLGYVDARYRCERCGYVIKRAAVDDHRKELIVELLGELPAGWYPEAIEALVRAAYRRGVLVPRAASKIVKGVEDEQE